MEKVLLFLLVISSTVVYSEVLREKIAAIENLNELLRISARSDRGFDTCIALLDDSVGHMKAVQGAMMLSRRLDESHYKLLSVQLSTAFTDLSTCAEDLIEKRKGETAPNIIDLIRQAPDCDSFNTVMNSLDELRLPVTQKKDFSTKNFANVGNFWGKLDEIPAYRRLRVSQDGSGNYTTIGAAVAAVPKGGNEYFLIFIAAGVYKEYITVQKNQPYLIFAGEGKDRTVITGDHSNITGWSTYESATVAIFAPYFIGYNLTIENTAGPPGMQAVALMGNADFITFFQCAIKGYQDTLYAHAGQQFYRECDIYGTIDFIFGTAALILQKCYIVARQPSIGQSNTIVAQKSKCISHTVGTTIQSSIVTSVPNLSNATKSYLGRPWGEYSRVAFMLSRLDGFIDPAGWLEWNATAVYLGEYKNFGAGADMRGRVKWSGVKYLTDSEAYDFTVDKEFVGTEWLDNMSIPYDRGF